MLIPYSNKKALGIHVRYNPYLPLLGCVGKIRNLFKGNYMVLYVMRYSVAITWDIFRLDWNTVEVDGVNTWDAPKFCDAFFSYAEYHDGTPLTDEELDKLTDRHGEELNTYAFENLL